MKKLLLIFAASLSTSHLSHGCEDQADLQCFSPGDLRGQLQAKLDALTLDEALRQKHADSQQVFYATYCSCFQPEEVVEARSALTHAIMVLETLRQFQEAHPESLIRQTQEADAETLRQFQETDAKMAAKFLEAQVAGEKVSQKLHNRRYYLQAIESNAFDNYKEMLLEEVSLASIALLQKCHLHIPRGTIKENFDAICGKQQDELTRAYLTREYLKGHPEFIQFNVIPFKELMHPELLGMLQDIQTDGATTLSQTMMEQSALLYKRLQEHYEHQDLETGEVPSEEELVSLTLAVSKAEIGHFVQTYQQLLHALAQAHQLSEQVRPS